MHACMRLQLSSGIEGGLTKVAQVPASVGILGLTDYALLAVRPYRNL